MTEERKPVFHGYARVSTKGQVKHGQSLQDQDRQLRKFFEYYSEGKNLLWGEIYTDAGVSAHLNPFAKREAGGALASRLRPGDHVAMISLDRGFRNFYDAVTTIEDWITKGIIIHFLDIQLSTDNKVGQMMIRMLAVISQFQRDCTTERTVAVQRMMKANGHHGNTRDYGWRRDPKNRKKIIPDHAERDTIRLIVKLQDEQGMGIYKIRLYLLENRILTFGGTTLRADHLQGEWSKEEIWRAYKAFKADPTFPRTRYKAMVDKARRQLGMEPVS